MKYKTVAELVAIIKDNAQKTIEEYNAVRAFICTVEGKANNGRTLSTKRLGQAGLIVIGNIIRPITGTHLYNGNGFQLPRSEIITVEEFDSRNSYISQEYKKLEITEETIIQLQKHVDVIQEKLIDLIGAIDDSNYQQWPSILRYSVRPLILDIDDNDNNPLSALFVPKDYILKKIKDTKDNGIEFD